MPLFDRLFRRSKPKPDRDGVIARLSTKVDPHLQKASIAQIGSESKGNWMWGDAGIGYFGLDAEGRWSMERRRY